MYYSGKLLFCHFLKKFKFSWVLHPQHPAPPIQLEHSHYLERCQICGITEPFAWQCSYLSTSALASLPPTPTRAQCPTFTTLYAHMTIHYSNPGNSSDWVVDSSASHHVTTYLDTLTLHEPCTASDSVVIGDGTSLSIANIGSFTLTFLLTPLLVANVLHVLSMSKNLISISTLCAETLLMSCFFTLSFKCRIVT